MQARDLTEEDVKKFEEFFKKEILPTNPRAVIRTFLEKKFKKEDCLFKEKCNKKGKING